MPSTPIQSLEHLRELVGQEVAVSDWFRVAQERIGLFAEATEDRQWIHVDPERARRESPYGSTIAHGFLTLSLLSPLASVVRVPGVRMSINYGLDRLRFPSAVPSGSEIRARFTLKAVEDVNGAVKATWSVKIECRGSEKPCCVADWIVLYYE